MTPTTAPHEISGLGGGASGPCGTSSCMTHQGSGPCLLVANEFAEVTVRRVQTGNGVRLEIGSPRLGRRILLDPLQLESLTWQDATVFSELLDEPFGPGSDDWSAT